MNLSNLSNEILEARFNKLVKTEHKITHLVLHCIAEIDRRKLYLEKAYSSLFEFLVQSHGYSPSAAMRRIDGARLLQQIPEVAEKLEDGSVNLSQVALLQRADRELKREMGATMPIEIKRELLAKIENQTQLKTEQMISRALNLDFSPKNKTTHHKDQSVTLTITLTREQMQILERAQATLSHAVPEKNWASLVTYLAKKELSRRAPKSKTKAVKMDLSKTPTLEQLSGTATVISSPTRKAQRKPISQPLKKQLLSNNHQCTFRDPQTGKICGSTYFLQVDHIQSVIRGGGNNRENFQILCGQHNRYKFTQEMNKSICTTATNLDFTVGKKCDHKDSEC